MADGKVVIQVDLNGDKAQSGVSKLKSLLGGLKDTGSKVGSVFKSVLGANLVSSAITSSIGSITNGVKGMIGELNNSSKAWQTFEGNMQMLGKSSDEIAAAKKVMQDYATQTIYSASDMAQTYSQLAAVGIEGTDQLVTGFGGLAAAAENPTQAMKTLSTQAVQMAAKPTVAWQDFKLMLEQTPAGISAVAKEMGMSTSEMVQAVQDGKIKTEDFFDAIKKVGNNPYFSKMATEFKTVDQAIDGAKESLANKLMPAFDKVNKFGIKAVVAVTDALEKIDFGKFADKLGKFLDGINIDEVISKVGSGISSLVAKVQTFWRAFSNTGAVQAFVAAISAVGGALGNIFDSFTSSGILTSVGTALGTIVKWLSQATEAVASFIAKMNPSRLRSWTATIASVVIGFKAFNFLKSFNPFGLFKRNAEEAVTGAGDAIKRSKSVISQVFNGIGDVVKSAGTAIKTALQGVQGVVKALGPSIAAAAKGIGTGISTAVKGIASAVKMLNPVQMLSFAAAFGIAALSIGAAIALVATQGEGVKSILEGVGSVVESFGKALGTVASMIIGALAQAFVTVAPVISAFAPVIEAVGNAIAKVISAIGGVAPQLAVLVTALGSAVSQIISTLTPFVEQLGNSISQVVTSVSEGISRIVESVGRAVSEIVTAFTPIVEILSETFIRVVEIVSDAIVRIIEILGPFMPEVARVAEAVSAAVQSIANAFTQLVGQISPIIDSISNLIQTFGDTVKTILEGVGSAAESFGNAVKTSCEGVGSIFESIGTGIRSALDGVADIIKAVGEAAKDVASAFTEFSQALKPIADHGLSAAAGITAVAGAVTGLGAASYAGNLVGFTKDLDKLDTVFYNLGNRAASSAGAFTAISAALMTMTSAITGLSAAMPTVASGFERLSQAVALMEPQLVSLSTDFRALAPAMAQLSGSILTVATGFANLGAVVPALSASFGAMQAGLVGIQASLTGLSGVLMSLGSQFMQLGASVSAVILSMVGSVSAGMAQLVAAVNSSMGQMVIVMTTAMSRAVTAIQSSMNQVVSNIRNAGSSMMSAGQQAGTRTGQNLVNGIRSAMGAMQAVMSQAVNIVRSTAGAGQAAGYYVGSMISQGIAQGMWSAVGSIEAAASRIIDAANRAAQAKAQIHSPSRLFRDKVGRFISQGIAVGIDKEGYAVEDSLSYINDQINAFKFGAETMLGRPGNFAFAGVPAAGNSSTVNNQTSNYGALLKIEHFENSSNQDVRGLLEQLKFLVREEKDRL